MYKTLIFPDRTSLILFEDCLNEIGLLHNYTSNYIACTFEKKEMSEAIIIIAQQFNGKICSIKRVSVRYME